MCHELFRRQLRAQQEEARSAHAQASLPPRPGKRGAAAAVTRGRGESIGRVERNVDGASVALLDLKKKLESLLNWLNFVRRV